MNKEKIENIVNQIVEIEKDAIANRFKEASDRNEAYSVSKADIKVVNQILSLMENMEAKNENS